MDIESQRHSQGGTSSCVKVQGERRREDWEGERDLETNFAILVYIHLFDRLLHLRHRPVACFREIHLSTFVALAIAAPRREGRGLSVSAPLVS